MTTWDRPLLVSLGALALWGGCPRKASQTPGDASADGASVDHVETVDVPATLDTPSEIAIGDTAPIDTRADVADAAGPDTRADAAGGDTASPSRLVWRSVTVPGIESEWVYAIWGWGPTELYVGTSTNKILHRNSAGVWSAQTLPGGRGIFWLWGSGPGDVYATTDEAGVLYHSTGTDVWTPVTLPNQYYGFPAQVTSTRGIWGLSADEVYVAGSITYTLATQTPMAGALFHLKNGAWTIGGTEDPSMRQIWGSSATDIYAIGALGTSLNRSAGDDMWTDQFVGNGNNLGALWGSDASNVFLVVTTRNRNQGPLVVYRSAGTGTWTPELSIEPYDMRTMWGSGPGDVYVGGHFQAESSISNVGTVYHRTADGRWTAVDLSAVPRLFAINCIWGNGATNVYVGGRFDASPSNGALIHGTMN
jgi:hypothetical protein